MGKNKDDCDGLKDGNEGFKDPGPRGPEEPCIVLCDFTGHTLRLLSIRLRKLFKLMTRPNLMKRSREVHGRVSERSNPMISFHF